MGLSLANGLNKLIKLLAWICVKRGRVYYITGESTNKEDVYMIRYIVFKSKYLSMYIHRFMRSDSSDPHDHPWNFITYIAEGGYQEDFYQTDKSQKDMTKDEYSSLWTKKINYREAGSIAYRKATDIHRVVVPRTYKLNEVEKAPLTACIMFKRQRHWGFWPLKDCGTTFIDWRKYLKIKPTDPRVEGSE